MRGSELRRGVWPRWSAWALLWLASGCRFVAAVWDFHGRLPLWRPDFPDHDCRHSQEGLLDWDRFRQEVLATPQEFWALLVWAQREYLDLDQAKILVEDGRAPECPLGTLFAVLLLYGDCAATRTLSQSREGCSEADMDLMSMVAQELLRNSTLELLLGTRWPLLNALDTFRQKELFPDSALSCEDLEQPILDYVGLKEAFHPDGDWLENARKLVYDRSFQANWLQSMQECPIGFAMVSMWKMAVCAETQAECVHQYATIVDDLVKSHDWRSLSGSPWPLFKFLARVQDRMRRHEFQIDFLTEELRGPKGDLQTPVLGPGAVEDALTGGALSTSYAGVLQSILANVPQTYVTKTSEGKLEVRSLLYITMVFGPRYVAYIPRFVARAAALGISNLVLFCLDKAAMTSCRSLAGKPERCIPGTPSILNKFTIPLAYLQLGVDVFWLDFDVFLLRNPTSAVLDTLERRSVDLLVSGSFADDCICSGIVVFRATSVMAQWLLKLLSWMYEHAYTHDQQAFSAFLAGRPDEDNATSPEAISSSKLFKKYLNLEVPKWALLDPVTEFATARMLNTTGWTGDLDKMLIFHFLHGDSEVNRQHPAYGWNALFGFANGTRQLLDIFYNQSDESIYTSASPPHHLSDDIRQALMESWRPERPKDLLHCGVLQLKPYAPGRMSPDG